MDHSVLAAKPLTELKTIASQLEMRGYQRLRKADLIDAIVRSSAADSHPRETAQLPEPVGVGASEDRSPNGGARVRRRSNGDADRGPRTEPHLDGAAGNGAEAANGADPGHAAPNESSNGINAIAASEAGTRSRVRTRTRERTQEDDASAAAAAEYPVGATPSAGAAPAATADAPAPSPVSQSPVAGVLEQDTPVAPASSPATAEQVAPATHPAPAAQVAPATQPAPAPQPAPGDQPDDQGDDEDGGRRRRRSRRERRRNKGSQPQAQQQAHRSGRPAEDETPTEPGEVRTGILDILPEGYGFLRCSGYLPGDKDVYVSQSQVRKHGLRRGDIVAGPIRAQKSSEKVPALYHVTQVNGVEPGENGGLPHRPDFKDMTPLFPDERLGLETPGGPTSMRIVDLMAPIGKGQRGLVVSPPKAGKTTILKELGQAIAFNNPECHLMVVLVDERPEEVTDMRRSIPGEVIASTFDRPADDHTQIAELAMERAKRIVEAGRDVVVLLDSITRLARAYNLAAPASGRIMSGGVDSTALYPPKRFFGAARNIEHGGSLTIIATALVETGSKMDEVIFEEFKGTGNMELRLDRKLEQRRIYPAIDIEASGTRKEELLLDRDELSVIWKLRRVLHALEGPAALELLIDKMRSTRSNNQFLVQIQKSNLQG